MKKFLLLTLFIAAIPSSVLAQSAYIGADGYFSIKGLQPSKSYTIDLGGNPLISAGRSNSCGILRIASSNAVKASDRIEIKDEAAGKIYGFENSASIPVKDIKCITGQVKQESQIWKDIKGTLWISGLTTSSAQTIRLLTKSPTRTIRANQCGMISFRLNNPQPKAIILNNQAYPLTGATRGGGIVCRKGKLYNSYPPQPEIPPVVADEWKQQNSIAFDINALITDNSLRWAIIKTEGGGGGTTVGGLPNDANPPTGFSICKASPNELLALVPEANTLYSVSGAEGANYSSGTSDTNKRAVFQGINFGRKYEGSSDGLDLFNSQNNFLYRLVPSLDTVPTCN